MIKSQLPNRIDIKSLHADSRKSLTNPALPVVKRQLHTITLPAAQPTDEESCTASVFFCDGVECTQLIAAIERNTPPARTAIQIRRSARSARPGSANPGSRRRPRWRFKKACPWFLPDDSVLIQRWFWPSAAVRAARVLEVSRADPNGRYDA